MLFSLLGLSSSCPRFCCFWTLQICLLSSSIRFVFFACLFVSLFFKSFPLDSSDFSCLRYSLMSSSHHLRGLPPDRFVVMLLPRPGFHSVIFFDHRCSGRVAVLNAILHFILLCVSIQQGIFIFHVFFCFFCTSLDVFDPSFFFNYLLINFFTFVFTERNFTVLVTARAIFSAGFWFFWPLIDLLFFFCLVLVSSPSEQ